MFWLFILFVVITWILFLWTLMRHKVVFSTSSGAIVMSLGILINGSIAQFPSLTYTVGPYLTIVLFFFLATLYTMYVRDFIKGTFYDRHLKDPILSFGTGTWIAATSITVVAITKQFPDRYSIAFFLYAFNIVLWLSYLLLIIKNYINLLKDKLNLQYVSGVVLLGCVSTQSILIAGNRLFKEDFPHSFTFLLGFLGFSFYILGISVVFMQLRKMKMADLAEKWNNTNCIIHGAVSISGLTAWVGHLLPPDPIVLLWLAALFLFIVIESIELMRGIQRIRIYGIKTGILVYSPTQWARNFTFGMFVAFSLNLPLGQSHFLAYPFVAKLHSAVLDTGKYIVITLFLIELSLMAVHHSSLLKAFFQGRERQFTDQKAETL